MTIQAAGERERWLFVDGAAHMGGHEVMLLRLIEELRLQGRVQPLLLCRKGSRLFAESRTFSVPMELAALKDQAVHTNWAARLWRTLQDGWRFARTVRQVQPALCVVAEGCLFAQPVFAFVARLVGCAVVIYVPLLQPSVALGFRRGRFRDALVRRCYANLPQAWIAITAAQGNQFAMWAGVRRPIFNLPNTVGASLDAIAQAREAEDFAEKSAVRSRLRVLVLGRLEAHQKGLDQLIDHLAAHEQLSRSLTIAFVGEGPYETELRQRLERQPSLRDWILIRPWGNALDVLRRHDLLLIPSRYEGVPLVMLEAMAIGVPVVATELPGTSSFLAASCLFPSGDLTRAFEIVAALADPSLRRQEIRRNLSMYNMRASGQAFSRAVETLTNGLGDLSGPRAGIGENRSWS